MSNLFQRLARGWRGRGRGGGVGGPGCQGNILPFHAPSRYPKTKFMNVVVLLACTMFTAATQGYDGSLMGGLNILPQYKDYFQLTTPLRSLNIAINYIGGSLACLCWTWVTDTYGRRVGLFWAAAITIVAAVLQAASVHIAMFCFSRVLIGFGNVASVITGAAYLAETLPWEQRAWGLALFNDFFYVGALAAAAVTLATFRMASSWAWRLPALLQCVWAFVCIALLPWMPESPRWLIDQGRGREALVVLARINANGNVRDDLVRLQFRQVFQTIEYERNPMRYSEMLANRGARKRLIITATCALFSMLTGSLIVTYYLGDVLTHAGVRSHDLQLLMNLGINATSLVVSMAGTLYVDKMGVKSATLVSTAGCAISLFILGVLSKHYQYTMAPPTYDHGAVVCTFLFAACYAFGWIPVLFLLPAEMLYFRIRALGMSMFSLVVCVTGIWANFVMPLALQHLGWRLWIINGAWNMFIFAFVWWYWIEIRGKTLEEIDALFDGGKRAQVPDVAEVLSGQADENWKMKMSTWMNNRFGRSEGPGSL